MIVPSEILYWEILPALRRELVLSFKEQGQQQSEIAKILELTPSAISQYLKSKRATNIEFSQSFKKTIVESAQKILQKESTAFEETNKLLKLFESDKHLCKLCQNKNNITTNCNACFKD
ncbi:ArsR family transcriptional regulator [Candidatus Woesearchaeota archaeon]|nr:ArsR family transcriptional regulator [Nanoarchaeota archaeon]MCB9370640.1 ArsR family transcriptional regulator [Candidatus Woesearchaeota archaeon]USN43724.1 MAG: ArsR family transcriptional regulator [Candidatus Woesearchaeota archaeon]